MTANLRLVSNFTMAQWAGEDHAAHGALLPRWRLVGVASLIVIVCARASVMADVIKPTGTALVNGLDVACELGFTDLCDVTRPTSLAVLISNYTGKSIDGRLVIRDKWHGFEIDLGEIFLSEQQTRRFSSIQDLSQWDNAVVELRLQDETLIWNQEFLLPKNKGASELKNVVLIVGNGDRQLKFQNIPLHKPQEETPKPSRRMYRYRYGYRDLLRQENILTTRLGTAVESINAATWQLPTHHAPLLPVRAMYFSDELDPYDINSGQWQAIAEWICLGGRVLVSGKLSEAVEQLLVASPLSPEPAHQQGSFTVRRIGAGAIYEFDAPVFRGDSATAQESVLAAVAQMNPRNITELASVDGLPYGGGRIYDRSRTRIIILFLVYTFFSGCGMLAMFRCTRKQVAVYLTVVVAIAAIGSGVLGANLRHSKGYLRWMTISQPGVSGGTLISRLEARSAGARSSALTVLGIRPNLQVTTANDNNNWLQNQVRAFTEQKNQLKGADAFRTRVKITPWGRRRLYAADFDPSMKRLEVAVNVITKRQLKLKITNPFSVDIRSGKLILMATRDGNDVRRRFLMEHKLSTIAAGQTHEAQIPIRFRLYDGSGDLGVFADTGYVSPPILNRPNAVTAWVFANLSDSPSLTFDETRSDFSSLYQLHVLAQEILPEKMPEYSQFSPFTQAPPVKQK